MDRTITIRIVTENLPNGIRGATAMKEKDRFVVLLNGDQDDPETVGSFVHEMLHIYHGDFESGLPVDQIEATRHRETLEIMEILSKRKDS